MASSVNKCLWDAAGTGKIEQTKQFLLLGACCELIKKYKRQRVKFASWSLEMVTFKPL